MKILLADDEKTVRITLADALREKGHDVVAVQDGNEALTQFKQATFDCVITDVRMPGIDGLSLVKQVRERSPSMHVIVITAYGSVDHAVEAMKVGANEFVTKPFDNEAIVLRIQKIEEETRGRGPQGYEKLVGSSKKMLEVYQLIDTVAANDMTVLIVGETGTGKEQVANAIHSRGPRKGQEMVKMSCANFPESLLEDALFGHEKGAFTDAREAKIGRFEQANSSTIFVDDIDDMPLTAQVKFLRVLQERQLERLGSTKTINVDVRVIAATKKDLFTLVDRGKFREDLLYRLNVVTITLPPLREREGDISILVQHFIEMYGRGKTYEVAPEVLDALERYPWPGNVRELEAAIQRSIALSGSSNFLKKEHLIRPMKDTHLMRRDRRSLKEVIAEAERQHIKAVLALTGGHKGEAAEILGISRKNLWEKLKEYELEKNDK